MGLNKLTEEPKISSIETKMSPPKKKSKRRHEPDPEDSDTEDHNIKLEPPNVGLDPTALPPNDVLYKLLDRIEKQLPKDDLFKHDLRVKKLDWEKIKFDDLSVEDCQKYWHNIQKRIRGYRILAEMITDARSWISQPWKIFCRSRDLVSHPDKPKKPLSSYFMYYNDKRKKLSEKNPSLTQPDISKLLTEKFQKLPEKKKAKYKARYLEDKKVYEEKLKEFYESNPDQRPVRAPKEPKVTKEQMLFQKMVSQQTNHPMMLQSLQPNQIIGLTQNGQEQFMYLTHPQPLPLPPSLHQQQLLPLPPSLQQLQPQQPVQNALPAALSKAPAKPLDLFIKEKVESGANEPDFDRHKAVEHYRQKWKTLKLRKKAKWIKKAVNNFKEYEEKISEFCEKNPEFTRPKLKQFLGKNDQKILDEFMGRPEKPPTSTYSLFTKKMFSSDEIKKIPSKDRIVHISEKWKELSNEQKDGYKEELNLLMSDYRKNYDEWFKNLTDEEREAETDRSKSSKPSKATKPNKKPVVVKSEIQPEQNDLQNINAVQVSKQLKERKVILNSLLEREPQEPPSDAKQFFILEYLTKHKKKTPNEVEDIWRDMDKKDRKKWKRKCKSKSEEYVEDYTKFVESLKKKEVDVYTEYKQAKENAAKKQKDAEPEMSDSEPNSDNDF